MQHHQGHERSTNMKSQEPVYATQNATRHTIPSTASEAIEAWVFTSGCGANYRSAVPKIAAAMLSIDKSTGSGFSSEKGCSETKIRYDKKRGCVVPDNGIQELLSKYGTELKQMRMAAKRTPRLFRSQEEPSPSLTTPKEKPTERFLRLVREKMAGGLSFVEAVNAVDLEEPGLRERVNEISTLKQGIEQDEQLEQVKARRKALAAKREAFTKQGRRW